MADPSLPNAYPNASPPAPSPPVLALPRPPAAAPSPPPPPCEPSPGRPRSFSIPHPSIRVTSEFDSESSLFFHKVSWRLLDRLAKVKLSFQNDNNGGISFPQLGFLNKHFSVLYDVESRNALLKGSFHLADSLQIRATHDVKNGQIGEQQYIQIGWSKEPMSISCTCENKKSVISCIRLGTTLFKYHFQKEQQGEVEVIASLLDPSYKLELSSSVPSVGLPRATFRFPLGEVSFEEKYNKEASKVLSMNGIFKGKLMNHSSMLAFRDSDLNIKYSYKDEEMTLIPSISLPSNALSLAFKRRFSPSDKLSYWYQFDSNMWSTVYKHSIGKDLKFKAGYDSEVRLGWASLWVGDEDGKTKTAPMKMKVQLMVQVLQDDMRNPTFMFRVKKRWDF